MFTGLIRAVGLLRATAVQDGGRRLTLDLGGLDPAIGASVAVDGVCLTVTVRSGPEAGFDAVAETLARSTLGAKRPGARLNLESALRVGDPLDGHWVLGHVDATARLLEIRPEGAGWRYFFSLPAELRALVAEKGSIAVDGVSLTVASVAAERFAVAVIPHTREKTTLGGMRPGDEVNLEADPLARYAARRAEVAGGGLTAERLRDLGY